MAFCYSKQRDNREVTVQPAVLVQGLSTKVESVNSLKLEPGLEALDRGDQLVPPRLTLIFHDRSSTAHPDIHAGTPGGYRSAGARALCREVRE